MIAKHSEVEDFRGDFNSFYPFNITSCAHSPFKLRVPVVIFCGLSSSRVHLANQTLSAPLCCVYTSSWRPLTTDTSPVRRLSKVRGQSTRAAMPLGKCHPQHIFSSFQSEPFLCCVHLGPSMIPPLLSRVIRFLPASHGFDKWPCALGPTSHFPPLQVLPVNVPILSVMYNGAQHCQTALNEIVFSFIVSLPLLRQSVLRMDISIEMPQ